MPAEIHFTRRRSRVGAAPAGPRPMRVAVLASRYLNPDNPRSWSGLPFFMRRALERAGVETITLRAEDLGGLRRWVRFLYWRCLRGRRFLRYCDVRLLRRQARQFERSLTAIDVDAIFSPSTWPLAFIETAVPSVVWTDACFAGLVDFYESFTRLAPASIRDGHLVEQRALQRCHRIIYCSEWAAGTARRHYLVAPGKISVVPFGGNLAEPPTLEEALEIVRDRDARRCRLLLVGVDWERKGAEIAVAAAAALRDAGVPCLLSIVGCRPPPGRHLPDCVELIPFIGKETLESRCQLYDLYRRSHFFIMPSRAEAFGLVYAEASAFGLPCLAPDVGGLASVITDGVNGHLFPLHADGAQYAGFIRDLWADPLRYRELARRSAEEGAHRLSWDVAGRRVARLIAATVRPPPGTGAPEDETAAMAS